MQKNVVKIAREQVRTTDYMEPSAYLLALYEKSKSLSDSYSYLKYAEDLGFAPTGIMNQIVRGRRPLTLKMAKQIVEAIELSGRERRYFLTLVEYARAADSVERETLFRKLVVIKEESIETLQDRHILSYYSEWFHPVIREMVGAPQFKEDPEWIAARLMPRVRPEQARKSLELLEQLGLIQRNSAGLLVQTHKSLSTARDVESIAITRYHQQMIEIGKESITRIPGDKRSITAVSIRISPERGKELMDAINEFQMKVLAEADAAGEDFQDEG